MSAPLLSPQNPEDCHCRLCQEQRAQEEQEQAMRAIQSWPQLANPEKPMIYFGKAALCA